MHSHKISTPTGTPVPDVKVKELSSVLLLQLRNTITRITRLVHTTGEPINSKLIFAQRGQYFLMIYKILSGGKFFDFFVRNRCSSWC